MIVSLAAAFFSVQTHFAVVGDYGKNTAAEGDVATMIAGWNPDFVVTTGDNNYETGSASTIDANIGKYYHNFIYNYTGAFGAGSATRRFYPCLGNHDWGNVGSNPTGANPYLAYFDLPGNERYYTFTEGECQFFVLDSDLNEPDGTTPTSVQGQWLQAGLATSLARYKIVVFHHAAFSSSEHGPTTYMQWPFALWGADAVLTGHDHTYERLNVDGIPYFVNGLGGKSIYTWVNIQSQSVFRYNSDYGAQQGWADNYRLQLDFTRRTGAIIESFKLPTRYPSEVSVIRGTTIGDISALFRADSLWFTSNSDTGRSTFDVVCMPQIPNPTSLRLEWKSRNNVLLGYKETVSALDVANNQWVVLQSVRMGVSNTNNSLLLPGLAQNYVDPVTGQVRIRMDYGSAPAISSTVRTSVSYLRLIAQ